MRCSLEHARAHRVEQARKRYGIDLTPERERMFLRLVAAQGHVLAKQPQGDVLYLVRHLKRWILVCVSERQRRIRTLLPLGPEAWLRQRNGDRLPVGTAIDAALLARRQAIRAPLAPPRPGETSGGYRARIEAAVTERKAKLEMMAEREQSKRRIAGICVNLR